MKTKHKVFNLIILDESGSMASIKDYIISGFNELVETIKGLAQKYPDQEHFISLVTFNGLGVKTLLDLEPVSRLEKLDGNKFIPDSMTPLYDAMGLSIARLKKVTELTSDHNVLVTILTDGQENASREFSASNIKTIVEDLKSKDWVFTYIGANHNVLEASQHIGIDNTMHFQAEEAGINAMWSKEKKFREHLSGKIARNENLKGDLYAESEKNE